MSKVLKGLTGILTTSLAHSLLGWEREEWVYSRSSTGCNLDSSL